jgi:uridine phosphorylase
VGSDLGLVGGVDRATWRTVLGLAPHETPSIIVVEGSWWREAHLRARLARLTSTRELGVPDVYLGSAAGRHVLYACHYGAARTAETIQIAVQVGIRLAVQIGSCGILAGGVRPGDVVVSTRALGLDGVTGIYTDEPEIPSSASWSDRVEAALTSRSIRVHRGPTVTWPTLFNQPLEQVRHWQDEGRLAVDMETATTFAVAARFDVPAVSMLVAWDELQSGRTFLDPLSAPEAAAFEAAEAATFDVSLELLEALIPNVPASRSVRP